MIISISGLIGSGKDSVANYLVSEYGFQRESWAGALKDAICNIFDWNRDMLEGNTIESRKWRETPDVWWSNELEMNITPRYVMQYFGTNVCRNNFHDDIWVKSLENRLRKTNKNIVISDTRFPNELYSVKKLNGISWRITRGEDPLWIKDYQSMSIDDFTQKYPTIHASEYASVGLVYDTYIENNSNLNDLYSKISSLVEDHLSST